MSTLPAGWYPDPDDKSQLRYWAGTAWTEHRQPMAPTAPPAATPATQPAPHAFAPVPPPAPAPYVKKPTGKWYFVITLASAGLLAAVPFFHAASHLRRPSLQKIGAGIAAASLISLGLVAISPEDASGDPTGWASGLGGAIALGIIIVSTALLVGLRREVYDPTPLPPPDQHQRAVASVQEQRRKRDEARRLAAEDPALARDLGIGRPDVVTGFNDGALLDLNAATAAQLCTTFGLSPEHAQEIVSARARLGRFVQVEDVVLFGQVDEEQAGRIRDLGIVLRDR